MKKEILVDIDVITEYLKTGKGKLPEAYETYGMKILSTTYTELLASTTFKDENLEKEVIDFVNKYFSIIDVDKDISFEAAKILRLNDVSLATALVAAGSKVKSLSLLTNNQSNYKGVTGVEFLSM